MLHEIAFSPVAGFAGMFQDPQNRWFALYLLSSLAIAYGLYRLQARRDPELKEDGFFAFAFPREIYTHRSARLDLWFYVINKLVFGTILAASAGLASAAAVGATWLIGHVATGPMVTGHPVLAAVITTVGYVLAFDFGLWLAHYLFHRVPVLWEFHKVHHSVEVLNPLSAGRSHPVDDLASYAMSALCGGTATAVFMVIFGPDTLILSPFQLHVVVLLFYLFGFHLRHSHIWLPYTGWLGRILISPAHHQVHHSSAERHWDRNMGFIFAIWDWMFGTLHVPAKEREEFPLGIGGEEREYNSVWRLYTLPFVKIWRRLSASKAPEVAANLGFREVAEAGSAATLAQPSPLESPVADPAKSRPGLA